MSPISKNAPIIVLLADTNIMAGRLLAAGLRRQRRFRIVECSAATSVLLAHLVHTRPSVLLIGVKLGNDGQVSFNVLRQIRAVSPETRAIVLLDDNNPHMIVEAFRAGAKGIFCRSDYEFKMLCKCVRAVHAGEIWANSKQMHNVVEALADSPPLRVTDSNGNGLLSKREDDVVRRVTEGLANREIAQSLGLSEHTIKNHLFRIFDKLGVSNRVELVRYAMANPSPRAAPSIPSQTELGPLPRRVLVGGPN